MNPLSLRLLGIAACVAFCAPKAHALRTPLPAGPPSVVELTNISFDSGAAGVRLERDADTGRISSRQLAHLGVSDGYRLGSRGGSR